MSNQLFISESQRNDLRKAYLIIEKALKDVNIDYEEFFILGTTLDSLKRAIEYEGNFY